MSNRAQISIELIIVVIAVLLSGAMVATKLTQNTFEGSSTQAAQSTSFCGFTNGFDVSVIDNSIVELTTGVINVNPTSSIENSEFSAALVNKTDCTQNKTYILDKNLKDLIMVYPDGTEERAYLDGDWQNFSATNIVLRLKTDYTCTIDGNEVTFQASQFEILCPPKQDSFNFQMRVGSGAGQFYLRLVDQPVTLKFTIE